MSDRFVNLALLGAALTASVTGVMLLGTSQTQHLWLYDLHRVSGLGLLLLLIPKMRIIWRALARQLARHSWYSLQTFLALALFVLTALTLFFALSWTLNVLPMYIQIGIWATPLAFHWYLAFALLLPLILHAQQRFPRGVRLSQLMTRRQALHALGLGALAVLGWGGLNALAEHVNGTRRFTGSRLANSFSANNFPITNSDVPPTIDPVIWRLRLRGIHQIEYSLAELEGLAVDEVTATIDCTLGWASTQTWKGVSLVRLLERAGTPATARGVTIRSQTGMFVSFEFEELGDLLLALEVGGETLTREHGYPVRLIAPARRGYQWLKWVEEISV